MSDIANRLPGAGEPLLLFDGDCGLCNAVVRFLMRRDRRRRLWFAPLQGEFGQKTLIRLGLPVADFDSLVFLPDADREEFSLKFPGVAAVLQELPGGWRRLGRLLAVFPAAWANVGYGLVARTRYALFGENRPRPWPDDAWAQRVIE
jgi:predicted DCC family thiol-disulfide oxidoreductase YuxK